MHRKSTGYPQAEKLCTAGKNCAIVIHRFSVLYKTQIVHKYKRRVDNFFAYQGKPNGKNALKRRKKPGMKIDWHDSCSSRMRARIFNQTEK
jgi:hypothetical protein